MNWQDYTCTNHSHIGDVGMLKDQYVCVHNIQSAMVSEFRFITKEEYDSCTSWMTNKEYWE